MLCEPYLLDPGPGRVHVLWHTAGPGRRHAVLVGPAVPAMSARQAAQVDGDGPGWRLFPADTTRLSRTREDASPPAPRGRTGDPAGGVSDHPDGVPTGGPTVRPVHRHLAQVTGLPAGRTPYRVVSVYDAAPPSLSAVYTLAPAAPPGSSVRLLLSSDHQLKPMVPANIAMAAATLGVELDGVLLAGDLVNVPDRASDWFDSRTGPAFFAAMTGRAQQSLSGRTWRGAPLLQHAPLFPAIGNHEVMGRWSDRAPLVEQFEDSRPDDWDVTTYEELFPVPASASGGPRWWSRTIGDVHVIALFAARMWRCAEDTFREPARNLAEQRRWGHGQFLFAPLGPGSAQYRWLERELATPACRDARLRVVMFHHPAHGLGAHSSPAYTDPVPTVQRAAGTGAVTAVRYDYPLAADVLLAHLEPLLSRAGVHLVLNGHSHLWNRFRNDAGVHWLETSNVGSSYGAYDRSSGLARTLPAGPDYRRQGDPGGLSPVLPTVAAQTGPDGTALPYLSSNTVTAFSVLDSAATAVRSYRFDTARPDSAAVLFDEFRLR